MSSDPSASPRGEKPNDAGRMPGQPPFAPPPKAAPAIWCSDCREPLRTQYFAMNDRPVCAKCREPYRKSIARGTGAGAMQRAVLWGFGAALGCAAVFAVVVSFIGFGRIPLAVGVGYAVGRAISAANGDYPGRRYQVLAAVLTYFAIGLGNVAPAVHSYLSLSVPERQQAIAREDAEAHPFDDIAARTGADASPEETAMEEELGRELTPAEARHRADSLASESRRNAGFFTALGALFLMLVTLPLVSGFAYGVGGAAVTLVALGYGVYKAWELTAGGPELSLRGPFRIGTGPISHTI